MDVPRTYGTIATGGVAVMAAVVVGLGVGAQGSSLGPPDGVVRGFVLATIVAAPGIIGLLGARRRDPVLLAGAGLSCIAISPISIATLALAVFGLLYLGASWAARAARPGRGWLLAPVVATLVVGGLATVLGTTEERCWIAIQPDGGGLEYRDVSPGEAGGPFGGPGLPVAGGCDSGVVTLPGAIGGIGLPASALILAWPRRRPTRPGGSTS